MAHDNNGYYVPPDEFTALYLGLLSVGVPDDSAQLLAVTATARTHYTKTLMWRLSNICELYSPWYCDPNSRIHVSYKPDEPIRYGRDVFVANVQNGLPQNIKRVVWSANRGLITEPYIYPHDMGWLEMRGEQDCAHTY